MPVKPPPAPAPADSLESEAERQLRCELAELHQEVAELRRVNADLREDVGYWQMMHTRAVHRVAHLEARHDWPGRACGILAKLVLAGALAIVLGWPALATALEATQAVARLESVLARSGWTDWAEALASWRGMEEPTESGSLMDPAGAAEM